MERRAHGPILGLLLAAALALTTGLPSRALAYEVLDNGKLRFGTGGEASVNTNGNLQQPFYFDQGLSQFFKLTFSNYPLDNAIGVGGDGTNEWNISGTVVQNSALAGQVLDVSGFTLTGGSKGYGVIVSTGTVTIGGKNLELKNTYTLGSDKSFIKIVTKITNTSGSGVDNLRLWVGTRDDWVGTSDQPTKTRGNLVSGVFTALTAAANRSAALRITSGASGVLFYSTSPKANMAINGCCSFSNSYNQNPATSAIQATNDGSYALFVRMNNLANGASEEFIWYYGAGAIADLNGIVDEVAQAANITVTASAGAGGGITPASVQVPSGQTTAFTVTPDAGYSIATVLGCGGSLVGSTYTTAAITVACAVTATFNPNQFTVSSSAGAGGSIGPTSTLVNNGGTTAFTITPAVGHGTANVTGCGGILTGNTYTTAAVTAACTVTASFNLNQYAVSSAAGPGGAIGPASANASYGETVSFTLTADAGFSVVNVEGCGGGLSGNTYTTAAMTADCAVAASFAPIPPAFDPVSPAVLNLDATTLLTDLPQDAAPRAAAFNGAPLSVTLLGGQTRFGPGEYTLTWRTVDSRGVAATVQRVLRVWPTVSLGPDISLGFLQGNSASLRIVLNGAAPQAPFTVGYTVSGHLTGHDLTSGSAQFAAGETDEVFFAVTETPAVGTPTQAVEVELDTGVNLGARHHLTVHLLANNAAPVVMLAARQGGELLPVFERGDGPVTIATDIRDPNSADTHTIEWVSPTGAGVTVVNGALVLQADSLPAGLHRFEAIVTDSGSPALSTHGVLDIVLAETPAPLPAGAAEWADNGLPDHVEYNPPQRNVLPEHEHDLTQFLIEGDPGLHLSLGPHALQEQRFQAQLNGNSIGADTVTNVGGYFDFTVSDLSAVGQSVNVVVPQHAPIPANPVYRKYDLETRRWNTFVENSNNALASAPGVEGLCPPPGSAAFRPGLNRGDWCVRLTLSDGGPNDGDGRENGVVVDPGGVGALATVVVTASGKGSGGGAFDPLLLLLSGVLLALRSKSRRWLLVIAALAGSTAASAENMWYGGLQLGPARGDVSEGDVNARLADAGYDVTATFADLKRNAWRVYAGYQLMPHLAIEGGYTDFGEVRTRLEGNVADITAFLADANQLHPHSAKGFEVSLHGLYPVTQRLSIGGRGGILRWRSSYLATNLDGEFNRFDDDGAGAFIGLGVEFAVYGALSVGIDWTRYRIAGESIEFTGFGVSYRLN